MDRRIITPESCREFPADSKAAWKLDVIRAKFIVKKQFNSKAGSKRLGVLWLVLDPLITTLIFLFVFTVIKYRPDMVGLFIGLTMLRGLQESIKNGVKTTMDFRGGMIIERINSRALILSEIFLIFYNTAFVSIGTMVILFAVFDVTIFGNLLFLLAMLINSIVWYGFGRMLAPLAVKIPDIETMVGYFGFLMFFMSPCLYTLGETKGLHRTINMYNPFSFTVEFARKWSTDSTDFELLDPIVGGLIFASLFLVFIIGLKMIDSIRWRTSTWS